MLNNRPRTRGAIIVRITLAKTVQRIAERSFVQWHAGSEGLGLILTPQGYELTATPERYNGARSRRPYSVHPHGSVWHGP